MTAYSGLDAEFSKYLEDRAVPPDIAAERGYRIVRQGKPLDGEYAAAWGLPRKAAGMLIPLHAVLEKDPYTSVQLRFSEAVAPLFPDKKGRPGKFRTPSKQRNVLATHPRTRAQIGESGQLIIIAEGVTRVDALAAYGIPAVGMTGIWNWRSLKLLPDFEDIIIPGNRIVIVPDGDVTTNRKVSNAVQRLSRVMNAKSAESVSVVTLPGNQGLDDWIAANSFPDKKTLVRAMRELETTRLGDRSRAPRRLPASDAEFAPLDGEGVHEWSLTPLGDAVRLLEYAADKLLVAKDHRGVYWPYADNGFGVWLNDSAGLERLIVESAREWQGRIQKAAMTMDEGNGEVAARAARWAVRAAKPTGTRECLESIGKAVELMKAHNQVPSGLTVCNLPELDADKICLGAPNGVIDLQTGTLLPPNEGRKRLVTRTVPDAFDPSACHRFVEQLVVHLDESKRTYLLDAFGYALRGEPARRWYFLIGQRSGGKSTLFNAVYAALGDVKANGYGQVLKSTALLKGKHRGPNEHDGLRFGLQYARIAVVGELPSRSTGNYDEDFLKEVTGGEVSTMRDVGEKALPAVPVAATLFVAANPPAAERLRLIDPALVERTRILRYPRLPAELTKDPHRVEAVRTTPAARQAMLALLVRHSARLAAPPEDVATVMAAGKEHRDESIGELGVWLRDNLEVTGYVGDILTQDELWDVLVDRFRESDGKIHGLPRRATWALARDVREDLPSTKTRGGKRAYFGVQITPHGGRGHRSISGHDHGQHGDHEGQRDGR